MSSASLQFWNSFEARIDKHDTASLHNLFDAAEPTNAAHLSHIVSHWLPSIRHYYLAGHLALAYVMLHAFYIFARNHTHLQPLLAEATVDQLRAMDFVLEFLSGNAEAKAKFTAENAFGESSRFVNVLLMLATYPDQFSKDDLEAVFKPVSPDALRCVPQAA